MATTIGNRNGQRRDVLGWRLKFGVLGPSTNTVVQPDFDDLRPPGVTNHYSRIFTLDADAVSNETFMAATQVISGNVIEAVKSVVTCSPDYLVMGMSAITFYGGIAGADAFVKRVSDVARVDISIGSHSCRAALNAYGGLKRIGFISPYFPAANAEVRRYFEESGFEVVRDVGLQCRRWTAIAEVDEEEAAAAIQRVDGDDVDALLQVGTNLSMIRLAAQLEQQLQKPVIAINTATYWHALRANGVMDQLTGFGRLFTDF